MRDWEGSYRNSRENFNTATATIPRKGNDTLMVDLTKGAASEDQCDVVSQYGNGQKGNRAMEKVCQMRKC